MSFSRSDPSKEELPNEHLSEAEEGEELSYAEILAHAVLNGEIIITIPAEDEERVKNGLKNYKSKQATKQKESGQPVDTSVLIFTSIPSKDFAGCIDMSIQSKNRGTIRVRNLRIPDDKIPD